MTTALFGLGAIGKVLHTKISKSGPVETFSSSGNPTHFIESYELIDSCLDGLELSSTYDSMVFCGGLNYSDRIQDFDPDVLDRLFQANVVFPSRCISYFTNKNLLRPYSRICVVSSIWQASSKVEKFSYTLVKSALSGMIRSASIDLSTIPVLVNCVLPGVVDTPMTNKMLTKAQIDSVIQQTPLGRLALPIDIANLISWLISDENTFTTGQSIVIDGGFLHSKLLLS